VPQLAGVWFATLIGEFLYTVQRSQDVTAGTVTSARRRTR
jgi:hypothetical protein